MKSTKKRVKNTVFVILLILLLSFTNLIALITDYLWFGSIGYESVFLTEFMTKLSLILPLWLFFSLVLALYLRSIYKSYLAFPDEEGLLHKDLHLKKIIDWGSVVIGGIVAFALTEGIWLDYLKLINRVSFGKTDPLFNLDIEFYVFVLPFLIASIQVLVGFLVILIMATALVDLFFVNSIGANPLRLSIPTLMDFLKDGFFKNLLKKISFLMVGCFVLLSILFYLNSFQLLYSTRGVVFGASYTDIVVTLWAYRTYAGLALASAVLTILSFYKKRLKLFAAGPLMLLAAFVLFGLAGTLVQQLIVEPDEISKESEYLVYNIENTQAAFGLDKVSITDYPYEENLTLATVERNNETIKNIRINDARPLKQTYNQIQGIRLYYDFLDIDTDRYVLDGEYTQVFIAPRELNQYKLDNKAMTWLNQHLKYTHGHGLVMSPVNKTTAEGQPQLLIKNIPPVNGTDLKLTRPEIYFGEETEKYIITNTDEKEFDYPSGSDNVEAMYSGKDGIPLGGINRLLFAIREASFKLFVSNNINSDSKIVIHRNIHERAREVAPFLTYDSNPYIVLNNDDGKLYWILDAYTETKYYPYSQYFDFEGKKVNYIRNAVKVVIDAYDGTMTYYMMDESDPIIQTYARIFPHLFSKKTDFPKGLIDHIKYPQDFFDVQAVVYRSYHVDNPVVFYNGEDVWDIALEKYMEDVQQVESNYVMFKIDDRAEFALMLPFTPKGKPNMTSLLVARNDAEHYGEVFLYRFPKDKTIQGPIMIESRIDQDSVISPQFTLWGQQGSRVLRGNVIVIPIESSLLYVEPIYLQADNAESLPEMKRVIVAYGNKIVMEQTLEEGLLKIFGEEKIEAVEKSLEDLIQKINDKFELTKESLDELQLLIDELKEKIK